MPSKPRPKGVRIIGSALDDIYTGTIYDDTFIGNGGNDQFHGLAGNDRINGGTGADRLYGDDGDDRINGDDGDDIVSGGAGNDTIDGGKGFDTALFGGDVRDFDFKSQRFGNWSVAHARGSHSEGADKLSSIERAQFDNYTVNLTGANNAPIAADDRFSLTENDLVRQGNVLTNDWDFEKNPLHVATPATVSVGAGAQLMVNTDGTWALTDDADTFGYLKTGETDVVRVAYTASDGTATSNEATLAIEISGVSKDTRYVLGNSDGKLVASNGIDTRTIELPGGAQNPAQFTEVGDEVYFTTNGGNRLWRYDGSSISQVPSGDLFEIKGLTNFRGDLYFCAYDATSGTWGFWKHDGATTTQVFSGEIREVAHTGGILYFSAFDENWDNELWVSDGTAAGTHRIADINTSGSSYPNDLTAVGDRLYFVANDQNWDSELWVTDGATATKIDINPFGSSFPSELTAGGEQLYFKTQYDQNGSYDFELWVCDGTSTTKIASSTL